MHQFNADRDSVINAAIDAGIERILILGIDILTSQQAIDLCEKYPGYLFAAIGVHPNSNGVWSSNVLDQLHSLAKSKFVIAIGEIGLDYHRSKIPIDFQKKMLISQLALAQELHLPVCIHNRNSDKDLMEILKEWLFRSQGNNAIDQKVVGVLHSFSGNIDLSSFAIESGFYLGISGTITFQNNHNLIDIINTVSLDKLIVETDSPYLTPTPFRGKRNQPSFIKLIVDKLSQIFNLSTEAIGIRTTNNAKDLFRW